ncbi:hypothetical protein HYDPIDRAFT_76162, partial [Hydnomerulius pinastri MD-312]
CQCPQVTPDQQHLYFLCAGLFPATVTRPETAFSFDVLDHYLMDNLECKTT